MKYNTILILILTLISNINLSANETVLAKLEFDSSKYIDVDELERGMEGYGLTVFEGTKIEKFKVRIVSVMTAKSIGRSAFLIKVEDNRIFDIARGVHGCSGSPVFFKDRLAGAMAFGWNFQEEPLYGVTPIRQMLNTYKRVLANEQEESIVAPARLLDKDVYTRLMAPEILTRDDLKKMAARMAGNNSSNIAGASPLPLSISINGLSQASISDLSDSLPGLTINAGAFTADLEKELAGNRPVLERGSTITIPLVAGDMEASTLGTVTEVIDEWVFAFGHSFNGNGPCKWPMATGYIHTFVSGMESSFKLGQAVDIVGSIEADEVVAICGRIGEKSPMTPARTVVNYKEIDETIEFNLELVQEMSYAPTVASIAAIGPAQYRGAMPDHSSISYDVLLDFGKFGTIALNDISSDMSTSEMRMDITQAVALMVSSPWDEVQLEKMESSLIVSDKSIVAEFDRAVINKTIFKPGETITADITCLRYRQGEVILKGSLKLPDNVKPGKYTLAVSGKNYYMMQLENAKRYIGYASCTEDIVKIMEIRNKYKRNNLFMTIVLPDQELALEEEPLDRIPASKAMLLVSDARQTPSVEYNNMLESITPIEYVPVGQMRFQIEVIEK